MTDHVSLSLHFGRPTKSHHASVQIVSNERYKAVIHRALIGGEQARTSVVSMLAPCLDVVLEPVQELAVGNQGLGFRGMKYGEYIIAHMRSNRANGQTAMDVVRAQARCSSS